jgi:DNA-binding response OmpR family regulator
VDPWCNTTVQSEAVSGKILVTGGDLNIRAILEYRLKQEGYQVLVSGNSTQALEQVRVEQPDLIILDLAVPHEEGLEFLKQIKARAESSAIPIIVLSTYRQGDLDGEGMRADGIDICLKPFSPRELVADVNRMMTGNDRKTGHLGR